MSSSGKAEEVRSYPQDQGRESQEKTCYVDWFSRRNDEKDKEAKAGGMAQRGRCGRRGGQGGRGPVGRTGRTGGQRGRRGAGGADGGPAGRTGQTGAVHTPRRVRTRCCAYRTSPGQLANQSGGRRALPDINRGSREDKRFSQREFQNL